MKLISGENLFLREYAEEDAGFIMELLNSPGWIEFIGNRNINSIDDALNYLKNGPIKSYADCGYGFWCVCLNDSDRAIGMCGFIRRDYLSAPDLGFAFLPEFFAKGFAYESASLAINLASHKFYFKVLVAITDHHNVRSIKLLNRLGFVDDGTIIPPGTDENLLQMKLTILE